MFLQWYTRSPVGVRTLASWLRMMTKETGLGGEYYTNKTGRTTGLGRYFLRIFVCSVLYVPMFWRLWHTIYWYACIASQWNKEVCKIYDCTIGS